MQKRQPEKKQITNNLTFCQNGATLCKDLTPRPYGITGKRSSRRTSGMSQIILRNRSKQPCQPNLTGKSVVKTQLGFTDSPSSNHLPGIGIPCDGAEDRELVLLGLSSPLISGCAQEIYLAEITTPTLRKRLLPLRLHESSAPCPAD